MPKTVFGVGTKEYGSQTLNSDGVVLRTKFYVFLYIPVWPVESRKVQYKVASHAHPRIVKRYVLERLPVQWRQAMGPLAVGWAIWVILLLGVAGALRWIFGA